MILAEAELYIANDKEVFMAGDIKYIDAEAGLKRVVNNAKLYAKLLGKFSEDPNFSEMIDVLAAGNMEKAKEAVHALKGLAANLSLIELHDRIAELEMEIKTGTVNPNILSIVKDVYAQTLIEVDKVVSLYA